MTQIHSVIGEPPRTCCIGQMDGLSLKTFPCPMSDTYRFPCASLVRSLTFENVTPPAWRITPCSFKREERTTRNPPFKVETYAFPFLSKAIARNSPGIVLGNSYSRTSSPAGL